MCNSIKPGTNGLRGVFLAVIILFACAMHVQAQSAQSKGPQQNPSGSVPLSSLAPSDLEALKKMIREEIKAEKEKQDKEDKDDKEKKKESEGGKDMKLEASWENGFVAETSDKDFRIHLGGRLEFDNAWFHQDPNLLIGSSPGTVLQDGTDLRRARLRADGLLWEFIDFVTEVNFANIQDVSSVNDSTVPVGSVGLTDYYVTFRDLPWLGNFRAGHFVAPYSLERYSSSNAFYYMERSSIYDTFFNPEDYQNGIMAFNSYLDDRMTAATSFTWVGKSTISSFGFGAEDGLYAEGVRLTGLPIYQCDGRALVHVGVNYFHQALSGHSFEAANRMPLRAGGGSDQIPDLLATGTFFSPNGGNVVDLEFATVSGPLSFSAEYARAWVNDVFESFNSGVFSGPRGNATYQAFYVESGLFITPGDHRSYDVKTGTWARTKPEQNAFIARDKCCGWCHGTGAVQLLARFAYLDLVSGDPTLTPTSGGARAGIEQDVTLGVNWFLNSQTIVSCNYVWTHLNSVVAGASGNIQGIGVRLHLDF
jgi:phosphate-selective porin OprO and OprP